MQVARAQVVGVGRDFVWVGIGVYLVGCVDVCIWFGLGVWGIEEAI